MNQVPPASNEPNSHPQDQGFAADLQILEEALRGPEEHVSLAQLEDLLQGRGFVTLILILSLPFIQPIPVPGLSILFGLAIFMLGLRIALGKKAGLPEFIRKKEFETEAVLRLTEAARKIFSKVENLFKRRFLFLVDTPGHNVAGLSLMANGVALSLPLPPVILFSNGLPALSVFLICVGLLERDGLFIAFGHILAILTWFYFGLWADLIVESMIALPELLQRYGQQACHFLGVALSICRSGG